MAEHAHVVRVTMFAPAEGRRADLLAACRQMAAETTEAEGCFGAQACEIGERPGRFAVVSRWRDRPSLDAFVAANTARLKGLGPLIAEPPETFHYTPVS